jgi:hypothetical protein
MGNVVDLHPVKLEENHEFVTDPCRYAEKILTEEQVKKKYHFDEDTWESLGSNDALVRAIEDEKIRRIRTGATNSLLKKVFRVVREQH